MSKPKNTNKEVSAQESKWKERIIDIVPNTGASVGGALIGLAIGGPVGAVTGAAVTPAATALLRIVKNSLQLRRERAERVLAGAAELRGESISDLENKILDNDDRLAFTARVLTAAADTPLPEKIAGFTRLLAAGIDASREKLVDRYMLVAQALAAMSESHMRVLDVISSKIEDRHTPENGWSPYGISDRIGESPENLRPLVRLLEFYGLITDVAHRRPEIGSSVSWQITDLGLLCLRVLKPAN